MEITHWSLKGQVAIVTGGGTGIGRSIALEFAKAGADVIVASRRLSVLEKVSKEVVVLGGRSLAIRADISQKRDVDDLVTKVMDEFGMIDILVNNAAIFVEAPLLEHSEEDWNKVIDTDLKGYYLCCQAVGKEMVRRKKGNIINIASDQAIRGYPISPVYAIAKAGVVMLTKVLAREVASYNVRVNAIAPGAVKGTEMGQSWQSDPEILKQEVARIPLGRIAEPIDIARVALFLASDASRHITGDTILVEGGLLT